MLKQFMLTMGWTLASVQLLCATTYYVNSSTGNDSGSGNSSLPWQTLTVAVPHLVAGDTLVATGTFHEHYVTFTVSGSAASPIRILGSNATINPWGGGNSSQAQGFSFSGNYVVLDGFSITGEAVGAYSGVFTFLGNNCTVQNFQCHNTSGDTSGLGGDTLILFQNYGNANTYSNITFNACNDNDLFRVWGTYNRITHCLMTNCQNAAYNSAGIHADFVQYWCDTSQGTLSESNIVECCVFVNNGISGGMLNCTGTTSDHTCYGTCGYWVYRNNIFVGNDAQQIQIGTGNFHLYNNVFYNWPMAYDLMVYYSGEAENTAIYNNVFIGSSGECGGNGSPAVSWIDYNSLDSASYSGSGTVQQYFLSHNHLGITEAQAGFVNASGGDFHLAASSVLRGAGVNLYNDPSASTTDKDGNPRPASGAWDIGPYQYASATTNPVISVAPSSLNFGSVASGATVTNTFTIQNVGAGILAGTATVPAPFSIVSGGTYSLGGNQTQTVSISYRPSGSNNSQVVTFTGGGGATATVSGSLLAILPGLAFESYAGIITAPFATNGGYVSQSVLATTVASGGSAYYYFNITNAGQYIVEASVLAPNSGTKSFWVNIDALPVDPSMVWDIYPYSTNWQTVAVSWRGNSTTITNDQYNPNIFTLASGVHDLIIIGREANVGLGQITIEPYAASRPAPPSPPSDLRVVSVSGP